MKEWGILLLFSLLLFGLSWCVGWVCWDLGYEAGRTAAEFEIKEKLDHITLILEKRCVY